MRFWLKRHYTVPACALFVFLVLLSAHVARGGGWVEAWATLHVATLSPSFADLRTITHSLDAVRHGLNPYVDVTFDPWQRVYNYPSLWLSLAKLGIGSQHTNLIGAVMVLMLVTSLTLLFDCRSLITRTTTVALVVSPPMLLLVERGNCDMLVFSMLTLGFIATKKWRPKVQIAGRTLLVILLTAMKIYPVVGVVALLRNWRSLPLVVAGAILALVALVVSSGLENLRHVFANTPQIFAGSYGATPLFQALSNNFGQNIVELRYVASLVSIVVVGLISALAFAHRGKESHWIPNYELDRTVDQVALVCLSIFLLSFMLGSNFDYRLVFLVGTVPPMLRAYDMSGRRMFLLLPLTIVLFLWISRVTNQVVGFDEVLDWGIFCTGAFVMMKILLVRLGWELR